MNTNLHKNTKCLISVIFLSMLVVSSLSTIFPTTSNEMNSDSNLGTDPLNPIDDNLEVSDTYHVGDEYELDEWWNTTYRYRIGIEIEELDGIDRHEPIEVFLEFDENTYYEGTERLVAYYGPGSWSDPLPVQVWDEYSTIDFIQNCSVTFIADILANNNQTYFFYYNENDDNIDTNYDYGTGFVSQFYDPTLTVNVRGDTGSDYDVILEEGTGVKTLELIPEVGLPVDFHSDSSLVPEKQLSHENLKLLVHMDENSGNLVSDATGNEADGVITGATWTSGIVKYGLDFEQSDGQDRVSWADGLEDSGEPFNDLSTQWTMTCWIKPESISSTAQTNHGTRNCFMAKASDPLNDNFEIGVNNDGTIHLYLDTDNIDTSTNIGMSGDITVGEWNFIALIFDLGKSSQCVELRINDVWYYSSVWDAAIDMDQAVGSWFTIGASEHIDTYFDGVIDEVALYNAPISHEDIETYKYLSSPSVISSITEITVGQVFSQYQVEWTPAFDMHVSDVLTFYYDYNLWNLYRTIYFENEFNGELDLAKMAALNTYYDFSGIDDHTLCKYIYDGIVQTDITNTVDLTSKDYTIVYNEPDASDDAIGIFITNYTLTDPAHSSISYFNGTINYYDQEIMFAPGYNTDFENSVGNETKKLIVDFWEFCDAVQYINDNALMWYFNNVSASLKNPVNVYIYEEDGRFYNIEVYVEDSDGRPVPEATITIWNNTASATEYQWNQDTGTTGWTTFMRFSNGTYVVNASYVRFGQTLTITTSKPIVDLGDIVNEKGVYMVNFSNVDLTSIVLNCSRYYESNYQGPLSGAKLNFTFDDGTGPVVLDGYETTNTTGAAVFRWKDTTSGNISLSIYWYNKPMYPISSPDDNLPGDITKINLNFTEYAWHNVSIIEGSEFQTHLALYDQGVQSKQIGEIISLWVNFSYTENNTNPRGMEEPLTVTMDLKIGTYTVNQNPLIFIPGTGAGNYSITLDTTQLIEPGGEAWMSSVSYIAWITASKTGFDSAINSTDITLLDYPTRLSANESVSYANWFEMLVFDVHFEYDDFGIWRDLDDAQITFYTLQAPEVFGTLNWYGYGGLYRLEVASTDFPGTSSYDLMISASLQNYEPITIAHDISILEIRTLLNGSISVFQDANVYFGESETFYFNYTVATSGLGLSGAEIAYFDWEKQDDQGNRIGGGYDVPLINIQDGIYALDFDTETLDIATYIFDITIKKNNYEDRRATLYLYITNRDFTSIEKRKYEVVSGKSLTITLNITDFKTHEQLDIDTAYVTFRGQTFNFTGSGGIYTAIITNIPDAFIMSDTILGTITIMRENYTTLEIQITIVVQMVEIFPGMPLFYFLMIIVAVSAVAGSLVTYRYVQQRRIPKFVKKAREMRNNIKGRKSISDSLLYPSKEDYIVKRLGDKWEMLGLSLEDILGIESKKRKKMSEITEEFEGGGL